MSKAWAELSDIEKQHARTVSAIVAVHSVDDDYGPFLVEIPERLHTVTQTLEKMLLKMRYGIAASTALRQARHLEDSGLHDITRELIALSLARIKKFGRNLAAAHTAWDNSSVLDAMEEAGTHRTPLSSGLSGHEHHDHHG
jgi:hypothetical protein